MLSVIGTAIICIVGTYLALNSILAIVIELCPRTRSYNRYINRLLHELSLEEIHEIGIVNLAAFAFDVTLEPSEFDYYYNWFISKER